MALKEALVLLLRCFSTAASVGEEDGEGPIVYFWRSRSERAGVLALEYALHVRRLTDISTEATAHSLLASQSRKSIWACSFVVEPGGFVGGCGAAGAEGADEDLGDDGADFAGGGGDAVGGGAVAGWEAWVGVLVLVRSVMGLEDGGLAYILLGR